VTNFWQKWPLSHNSQQLIKGAMEKGASSWLPALPIKTIGYTLNKQEFTDAICMRYGWKVKGIPIHLWRDKFCWSHLICKLGSYTSMRHNSVKDSETQIMREICRDVQTEPTFLPINENDYQRKVNTADNARLDISVRGLWNSCEKTFFDIRITRHILPHSHILESPWQRSTNNMKRKRINTINEWLT